MARRRSCRPVLHLLRDVRIRVVKSWAVGLTLFSLFGFAGLAASRPIPSGARIYIEPMPNDFDTYLKAEIIKKRVPVVIVSNPETADFLLGGTAQGREKTEWHEGWLTSPKDKYTGAVELVNERGELVWAAEAGDRSLWFPAFKRGGARKAADRIAKQMKRAVGAAPAGGSRSRDWWQPAKPSPEPSASPRTESISTSTVHVQTIPSRKTSLAECLAFENLRKTVLDNSGEFWTIAWTVEVVNGCNQAFRVEVVFTAYDENNNRLEEADEVVQIAPDGVTSIQAKMAIEAVKARAMALEGVGLRTAP